MRQYELLMVVRPDADDEQMGQVLDRVKRFIADHGGEVSDEQSWGRRKLAYQIGKYAEGNYYIAQVELEPPQLQELEGTLNLSEDVIRHMVVLKDLKEEKRRARATAQRTTR